MKHVLMGAWQMGSWHEGGMFIGMHWIWWLIWVATMLMLGWAFVRLYSDRSETRTRAGREEAAEESLRRRFADGEINEDEYAHRLKVLRETILGN